MCRSDKAFDPFVESTVDGIIAGSVSVKVRHNISTILILTFVLDPNNNNDILILILMMILITMKILMMIMMIIDDHDELILAGHFWPVSL